MKSLSKTILTKASLMFTATILCISTWAEATNANFTDGPKSKETVATSTVKTTYPTLDQAIARGDVADVKLHLAQHPELLNGYEDKTRAPLCQAILRNKTEIALFFIASDADPNLQDSSQRTLLHTAVERGNANIVTALLKAGAKPNLLDKGGWTPLHHAAAKNKFEVTKALLEGGANPMTLSELGGTPLHEAAVSADEKLIQLLLDHHVDPTIKSKDGSTALDIAQKYHHQVAIDLFQRILK